MRKDINPLPIPRAFFTPLILLKNKPLRLSVHFYTILPATLHERKTASRESKARSRYTRDPSDEHARVNGFSHGLHPQHVRFPALLNPAIPRSVTRHWSAVLHAMIPLTVET